jgi:hypothetical protein
MAKMASAKRAANSRPFAEAPAWRMAGPFWGERTTVSGPRDLKCRPRCSILCTLAGSAKTPCSRSITTASASQLFQSARQTSMNSSARS